MTSKHPTNREKKIKDKKRSEQMSLYAEEIRNIHWSF